MDMSLQRRLGKSPLAKQKQTQPKKPRIHPQLRAGPKSQTGPAVIGLTASLRGQTPMEKVRDLGRRLLDMPVLMLPMSEVNKVYAKRSAEQIIRDNRIVVAIHDKREKKGRGVGGCVDYSLVAVACLRVMGIPCRFVRQSNHSYVRFAMDGKGYTLDPMKARQLLPIHDKRLKQDSMESRRIKGELTVRKASEWESHERRRLSNDKRDGKYIEGTDAHTIGIRSIADYDQPMKVMKKKRTRPSNG